MTASTFLNNLLSWSAQVFVIASVGAILPLIFRIRHPKSHLAYCHVLLIASLLLPMIQPWQHPIMLNEIGDSRLESLAASSVIRNAQGGERSILQWDRLLLWILAIGIAARLCWLCAGLWQIRRYRMAAQPLHSVPPSIDAARAMSRADAVFCISSNGAGPVTFGFIRPVILLPKSFLSLEPDAQCGIACHELLHVRRKDWLVTVLEETGGALLWFHPAVWWLLVQARLSREQVVDAEVVRLTAAREPYINALLQIAGATPPLDLAPAPLFLRRRHLTQRMHSLLTEVSMSKLRLLSSYASMAAILAVAAWSVFVSFPLVGQAEVRETVQVQPGYVVNRAPTEYPGEAREKKIEGTVVVELTFNANGEIVDARVLSGPDELRKAALQSALRGTYGINVARTLQVVMDFKLSAFTPPPPPAPHSPQHLAERRRAEEEKAKALTLAQGKNLTVIRIAGLPEPRASELKQRLQSFQGQMISEALLKQIRESVHSSSIGQEPNFAVRPADDHAELVVSFGPVAETLTWKREAEQNGINRIRVGGEVQRMNLVEQVKPVYPPLARQAEIQGVVVLEAEVNKEGRVEILRVLTGHPLLLEAAIEAVKQWVYKPTLLNGEPVNVVTTINVNFALQK